MCIRMHNVCKCVKDINISNRASCKATGLFLLERLHQYQYNEYVYM